MLLGKGNAAEETLGQRYRHRGEVPLLFGVRATQGFPGCAPFITERCSRLGSCEELGKLNPAPTSSGGAEVNTAPFPASCLAAPRCSGRGISPRTAGAGGKSRSNSRRSGSGRAGAPGGTWRHLEAPGAKLPALPKGTSAHPGPQHGHGGAGEAEPALHQHQAAPSAAGAAGAGHGEQRRGAAGVLEALHPRRLPARAPDLALLLLHALPAAQRGHQRVVAPGGRAGAAAALPAALAARGLRAGRARPAPAHHPGRLHHLPELQQPRPPAAGQVRVLALQLLLHGLRGGGRVPVRQRPGSLLLRHRAGLAPPRPRLLPAAGGGAGLAVLRRLLLRQVPFPPPLPAARPPVPGAALGPGLPAGHQPRAAPHLHRRAPRPRPALPQVPGALLPHRCLLLLPPLPREVVPREVPLLRAEPPDLPRVPGAVHAGADRGRGAGLRVQEGDLLLPPGAAGSRLLRPVPPHRRLLCPHGRLHGPEGEEQAGPQGRVKKLSPNPAPSVQMLLHELLLSKCFL
ncbi:membrane progestin receptor alpha isoform X1 [Catharus ustulatus]|uniref:membrane progestin receptor alpha isoform X1 n=1 Tax=Catharus ustulatus TaxID=91951 RepID=UPI00140C17CE|nr:membrane progestin receptor alpha isoform X1 [Catharus ustulatus]